MSHGGTGVSGAQQRIRAAMALLPGVEVLPHRFGGIEFRIGRRELGHVHGDWLVDIPFPKRIHDEIIAAGAAEPHHILPSSGWVSLFLKTEDDVERSIKLLERSFDVAAAHRSRSAR